MIQHLQCLSVVVVLSGFLLAHAAGSQEPSEDRSPGRQMTVRDFGAIGDERADDTAALQAAVDASLGDVIVPRGSYRITKPIVIDLDRVGPTSIAGTGTARIIMAGPGAALEFVGTHEGTASPDTVKPNVWQQQRMPTVDGLEIVGVHEEACGIEATGTMKLTITRVTIRKALHAIHLTVRNRNVIVSNCHLYENRGVGLYLDGVNLHQINVTGCHISYNGGGGIVVRGGDVRNLQVSGCDIEANVVNVLLDSAGAASGVAEVAITGCTLQHAGGPDSANVRFLGADPEGKRTWGHLSIGNNVISDTETNLDIRKAQGVSIMGNTFGTGYRYHLRIEDSSHVAIGPNTFDRNPRYKDEQSADNALVLRQCDDLTLSGLHISGVRRADAGLLLEDCRRVNLTDSTILDCDNAGLVLKNVSFSRVSDCLIRNDRPGNGPWLTLKASGGQGNMIVDNLLGGPMDLEPNTATSAGNVTP